MFGRWGWLPRPAPEGRGPAWGFEAPGGTGRAGRGMERPRQDAAAAAAVPPTRRVRV